MTTLLRRYSEVIALPSTKATWIAKELTSLFARVGLPEEILTDQGPNFMSALLEEVYSLLHIQCIRMFPYNLSDRQAGGKVQWHLEVHAEEVHKQQQQGLGQLPSLPVVRLL